MTTNDNWRGLLESAMDLIKRGDFTTGYCCCGGAVESHGMGDGHSPVDQGHYSVSCFLEQASSALAATDSGEVVQVSARIAELEEQHGGLRSAAKAVGLDAAYLSRLKSGLKLNPGDDALAALGLKREVRYLNYTDPEATPEENQAFQLRSRAAKVMDEAWRRKNMVPCCPHCHAGILPEDVANGVSEINKAMTVARRNKTKGDTP